jgi:hypothetical protein
VYHKSLTPAPLEGRAQKAPGHARPAEGKTATHGSAQTMRLPAGIVAHGVGLAPAQAQVVKAGGKTIEIYRIRTVAIARHGGCDRSISVSHGIHPSMMSLSPPASDRKPKARNKSGSAKALHWRFSANSKSAR